MKKKILSLAMLSLLTIFVCLAATGCAKLSAPQNLRLSDDGVLCWNGVEGAAGYRVCINEESYDTDKTAMDIFYLTDGCDVYLIDVAATDEKGRIKSPFSQTLTLDLTDTSGWRLELNEEQTAYSVTGTEDNAEIVCGKVVLPSVHNGKPVTGISKSAFFMCDKLTSVIIPDSITEIGVNAFAKCANLVRAELPSGLKKLEKGAFSNCLSLTEIRIPKTTEIIAENPIYGSKSIKSIEVEDGNEVYESTGNCIIRRSDRQLVLAASESVMPQDIKSIGDYAFAHSDIEKAEIPKGVESIGEYAFDACSKLTELYLPDGVKTIGASAFQGCSALTYAALPRSVEFVGTGAFWFVGGLSVVLPKEVKTVKANAFDVIASVYTDLGYNEGIPEGWKMPQNQMDFSFIGGGTSNYPRERIVFNCQIAYDDGVPYVDAMTFLRKNHIAINMYVLKDNLYQAPCRRGFVFEGWANGNDEIVWRAELLYYKPHSSTDPVFPFVSTITPQKETVWALPYIDITQIPSDSLLRAVWRQTS
ncbi:MAG: leucine-rich repeat domain-containing protein [Christensenellales bacterium]